MANDCYVRFETQLRLAYLCRRVGGVPQKAVTKGTSKGLTVLRRSVRSKVPVDTGSLKKGLQRKSERSRTKGKKVYELRMDPAMNDIFQKPVKNPGEAGSKNTRGGHAYYPASQEYGFLTRSKGGGLSYVPGYHFLREGAEESRGSVEHTVIETVMKEVEKEWKK